MANQDAALCFYDPCKIRARRCTARVRSWPISEATAAGRGVWLLRVYLSRAWRSWPSMGATT